MSSAILYLAIIGIWAGVLIPRWLRRDSARGHPAHDVATPPAGEADDFMPASVPEDSTDELDGFAGDLGATVPDPTEAYDDTDTSAPEPPSPDQSRRRVLAARRRLLWMMLALEAAADVLAASGLAAWWVIAPPTVMLAGYLVLLREAAQADAERDARERDARERDAAQAREPARQARIQATEQSIAAPAVFAAAPVPEDYSEDYQPGRDFTPGGRYATSADDDAYDQYTENRLRAVGD